jgi:hypothetical protein
LTGFIIGDDTRLDATLTMEDGRIRLFAGVYELGDWPIESCSVTQHGSDRFLLEAEGETLTFIASEPEAVLARIDHSGNGSGPTATDFQPAELQSAPHDLDHDLGTGQLLPSAGRKAKGATNGKKSPTRTRSKKPVAEVVASKNVGSAASMAAMQSQPTDFVFGGPTLSPERIPISRPKRKAPAKKAPVEPISAGEVAVVATPPGSTETFVDTAAVEVEADRVTVADRIVRGVGRHRKAMDWRPFAKLAAGGLVAVAALVGFAWGINSLSTEPQLLSTEPPVPQRSSVTEPAVVILPLPSNVLTTLTTSSTSAVPASTATSVASPTTTAAPTMSQGFLTDTAAEFTRSWNSLALAVDESLALPAVPPEPFTVELPHINFAASADPLSGLMQSLTLTTYPQGEPEADRRIITALGLAIGASEPALSGSERRALLNAAGLDVANPQLEGLDGTVVYGGLSYHLVYLPETVALQMTISPSSSTVQG